MPHLFPLQYILNGKPVNLMAILMSFLNFLTQKHTPVTFQDQRLFETEVIKEKVVFKMSAETQKFAIY